MLKKFLNDESKSPVIDFLLWLIVYPFVIAFAVACAINIFQFSVFQNIKFTDWVMAGCTFLILIGTWKAAGYAKKAAHQAQIQNNNAIISKIDDLYKDLGKNFEDSKNHINEINNQIQHLDNAGILKQIISQRIDTLLRDFLKLNSDGILYKYRFFIENIIGYKDINNFYSFIYDMRKNLMFCQGDITCLKEYLEEYIKLMDELLKKISDKYQELNGSS